MKRKLVSIIFFIALCLTACGSHDNFEDFGESTETESISKTGVRPDSSEPGNEENNPDGLLKYQEVILSGQGGIISVQIPEGWESVSFPACGNDESYRIRFYPENVEQGYMELSYMNFFGVCGTGLVVEEIIIAGDTANMGTYDNHKNWDYIAYGGKNKGLVASAFCVDDWREEYIAQTMEILDTADIHAADPSQTKSMFYEDTNAEGIGLSMSIGNISRTSAELSFIQYDGNPQGSLEYGDDFIIEKIEKGEWMEAPVVIKGDYGFNSIAYQIMKEGVTDFEIDWEWLYGELEPGEYRVGKSITDLKGAGSYDEYRIYIHFIIN